MVLPFVSMDIPTTFTLDISGQVVTSPSWWLVSAAVLVSGLLGSAGVTNYGFFHRDFDKEGYFFRTIGNIVILIWMVMLIFFPSGK